MCFRPAQISMKTCLECGATNKPVARVCEKCGAELPFEKQEMDADQKKLDSYVKAPGIPGAPVIGSSMPSAPSAPSVPKIPSAPKTPGA